MRTLSLWLAGALLLAGTVPAAAQDRAEWPRNVVVGTASPGGTFAIYGQGIATVIGKHVGVPASTQQTQGPIQNLILVGGKRIDVGLTTMGPAYEAVTGELELARGRKFEDLRALFPMFVTPFQAVALTRSGIRSVSGMAGKVVGTGPRGGTGGTYWERWFEQLGLKVTVRNGPLGDQASQLADGRLDAVATAAGLPTSAISELETLADVTVFGLTESEISRILPKVPYAQPFSIPAGTYRSVARPVTTLGMWNVAFTHASMPASLAYEIVKAVFEHHDEMVATHASAAETVLENVTRNTVLQYHPGAVRYYREKGLALPAALIPKDMAK